jgi:hypothetical protein
MVVSKWDGRHDDSHHASLGVPLTWVIASHHGIGLRCACGRVCLGSTHVEDFCPGPWVTNGLQLSLDWEAPIAGDMALERDGDGDRRPSRAQSSSLALQMALDEDPHVHTFTPARLRQGSAWSCRDSRTGLLSSAAKGQTSYSQPIKASQPQLKRIPFSRRPGTFCSHSQFHADGPGCCIRIHSLLQWQAQSLCTYRRNPYSPPHEPVGSTRVLP